MFLASIELKYILDLIYALLKSHFKELDKELDKEKMKMVKLRRFRYNPILRPVRKSSWESRAVFNPGAIYRNGKVHLLYRAIAEDDECYVSRLGYATSTDGLHFRRESNTPVLEPKEDYEKWAIEDPRITELEGKIYITYVAIDKPALTYGKLSHTALASTKDFRNFRRLGLITKKYLDDRDTVIFPEKIRGKYVMFHRPQGFWPDKHYQEWKTRLPSSIWISFSSSLTKWRMGKTLMRPEQKWEAKKIGIGPSPIKTSEGWLLLYHGVDDGSVYRGGAALLDLVNPEKVVARLPDPIIEPEKDYEKTGDISNVVFPEGAVVINGTLFVYYGGADKVCCAATISLDDLLDYLMKFKTI